MIEIQQFYLSIIYNLMNVLFISKHGAFGGYYNYVMLSNDNACLCDT